MLTALSSTKSKMMSMEYGASLYIEKPFDMDYLLVCIRNILEKKQLLCSRMRSATLSLVSESNDLFQNDEKFLAQLDAFILDNLSDADLSNDQLAAALCISKPTLIRKMKGLLDTTPGDYVRGKRLAMAAHILSENSCRINEVCYSVGFNTPSYFAKCFKKAYGVLPAEYMKGHQTAETEDAVP
jgi:AraC-like DNA-binding protein